MFINNNYYLIQFHGGWLNGDVSTMKITVLSLEGPHLLLVQEAPIALSVVESIV